MKRFQAILAPSGDGSRIGEQLTMFAVRQEAGHLWPEDLAVIPVPSATVDAPAGVVLRQRLARDSRIGPEGALAAIAALHGLGLRASFELASFGSGGELRVWAPRGEVANLVRQQLGGSYPRSQFQEVDSTIPVAGAALGVTLGLRLVDPIPLPTLTGAGAQKGGATETVAGLLAALDDVGPDECAVFQMILRPCHRHRWGRWARSYLVDVEGLSRRPERSRSVLDLFHRPADPLLIATEERLAESVKSKLRGPLFQASVRVLASSGSRTRTIALLRSVLAPVAGLAEQGLNELVPVERLEASSALDLFQRRLPSREILLSAHECIQLWHPPAAAAGAGKGTVIRGVDLPITTIPLEGLQLGWTSSGNDARPVRLPLPDLRKHAMCLGTTGGGKSTTLLTMLLSAIEAGHGCGLIDVKGDLANDLLGRIPEGRRRDVVVIDPTDAASGAGIDLYGIARRLDLDLSADFVVSAFRLQYFDNWGVVFPRLMKAANRALLEVPGTTLLDLPKFLRAREFRAGILARVRDEAVRDFFRLEFDQQSASRQVQAVGPVLTRVGAPLESAFGRNIFGQSGGVDLRRIMDSKKILICSYHAGLIGKENASVFAGLTAAACQLAAMTRVELPEQDRHNWLLVCDEAHNYATTSFSQTLSEGRGYGFSVVLATQFLSQLPPDVRSSVLANASTLICFRLGEEDAALIGRRFEPYVSRFELTDLSNFVALVRTTINGERIAPFSLHVRPPATPWSQEVADQVREISRSAHRRSTAAPRLDNRHSAPAEGLTIDRSRRDVDED